ncbi:hypothetical protein [uncultured Roseibium sp.]|uniref:lysozyme n=1 Tax=uncultured Roseibium sp. TaxID=1936171 RepID=UPI00259751BA|nr:hypothetical protein [uncultured Roseibium sp.]
MANLAKYKGTNSLPGVRQPQVVADTSVGRATANLGGQIQRTASAVGNMADVADAHAFQAQDFERKKRLLDLSANVDAREVEEVDNLQPGASGYEARMMQVFDEEAQKFRGGLPDRVQANADLNIKALRSQYEARFRKTERTERDRYYTEGIAESGDRLAKGIRNDPSSFDVARETGRELIVESGLNPIAKQAALRSWDRMASLAWVETLPASERSKLFKGAAIDAGSLLRAKEGFRAKAYADTGGADGKQFSGWRVGYGSDTVTKADGSIVRVTKDTVITQADAERDLQRRSAESANEAIKSVGAGAWQSLPPRAQAALTSITYNYGELPKRLHAAVKSGDLEAIAGAIEGLKGDNGGVNSARRQEEADIVRGLRQVPNASPEIQARLDALSYDDQVKLSDQAQRDMVGVATDRKESFALAIAQDPLTVDRDAIISDNLMDDGQKASLVRALDAAMKSGEDTRNALAWVGAPGKANPFDPDDRKAADKVWDETIDQASDPDTLADSIVSSKGVIPKQFVNEIRNGLQSPSIQSVQIAHQRALRMLEADQNAVRGAENGSAIEDAALKWRVLRESLGLSVEQAAGRLAEGNTPDGRKIREALLESPDVQQALKEIDVAHVESLFDPGWLSSTPKLGATPAGAAVAVSEYQALLRASLSEVGGNVEDAEALAKERLSRLWGTSDLMANGDDVVMKYVPEKLYPEVGGSHEYIRDQAKEALDADGVHSKEVYLTGSADFTVQDLRAGKAPGLVIQYRDEDGVLQNFPFLFRADPSLASQLMSEKRAAEIEELSSENQRLADRLKSSGSKSRVRSNRPAAASSVELLSGAGSAIAGAASTAADATLSAGRSAAQGLANFATNDRGGGDPRSKRSGKIQSGETE